MVAYLKSYIAVCAVLHVHTLLLLLDILDGQSCLSTRLANLENSLSTTAYSRIYLKMHAEY